MTSSTEQDVIWLTEQAHQKLTAELEYLRGPRRAELSARIGAAREEGDLRENGAYQAAKDEQGKSEARIRQLEQMLRQARVGQTPSDDGVVEAGMKVSVRFGSAGGVETFLLGAREVLDFDSSVTLDVYSPQSPLGAAILGKRKGDTASYEAPNGNVVQVEIVDAVPFTG